MSGFAILGELAGGAAKGYAAASQAHAEEQAKDALQQRQLLMGLSGELLNSPNVPAEYKGSLVQFANEVAQTPFGKKLPSLDKVVQSLPAVQRPKPPVQTAGQVAPTAATPPTVTPPTAPGAAPQVSGGSGALPGFSLRVQPPQPPPFSEAGNLHFYTPQEQEEIKNSQDQTQLQSRMSGLRQQFPNASDDELFNAAMGHAMPSNRPVIVPSGAEAIDPRTGQPIAQNTIKKPLPPGKMQYEPDIVDGQLAGVKDNVNGITLNPEEAAKVPDAKKVFDMASKAQQSRETQQEAKEQRQLQRQVQVSTIAFQNAIQKGAVDDAAKAKNTAQKDLSKLADQQRQDQQRYDIMLKAKEAADKSPDNVGSFDAALLAFHMGMTVGTIKGARTGKDLILMHEKARSLGEDFDVAVGKMARGELLSPEQRTNFMTLAQEKMQQSHQAFQSAKGNYDTAFNEYSSLVKDVTKGKAKVAMPSKPQGERPPLTQFEGSTPQNQPSPASPLSTTKALDEKTATAILAEAGGDKNKARQIAKTRGYQF